jgi:DNA-nicking Smr family endonuclease
MGNCFGFSSAASPDPPPADVSAPPAKKQRKEQPFVTDQVETFRNQASAYHDKVVQCAKRSQEAWKKGEKSEAHTLSEEKKGWQKNKDEANRKAAKIILESQKWQTSGEIDLHGLYLDEALDATRAFLKHWSKKASGRNIVLIITGAGHHSENNKAVIRPKVEEFLQEQRLEYESVHGNGAFRVTLKASQ